MVTYTVTRHFTEYPALGTEIVWQGSNYTMAIQQAQRCESRMLRVQPDYGRPYESLFTARYFEYNGKQVRTVTVTVDDPAAHWAAHAAREVLL